MTRVSAGRSAGTQLPADRYLEVRYKELVTDPPPSSAASYLGRSP